ncbi:hypothetical protein P154DRAFT_552594 [Amniculicola lignicola CBS 123094]|uniref:Uncharacterized protein n=1 Tax=Amniculicola lignicola CBS 123094 TaxID=1392246 RepID=A0A6A5WVW4_9PLEO|nr:hypothetical protein P154DRAFT_552594 [Amniculicola lignicola CBS 123094]
MPRKLPWLNKGARTTTTQVKPASSVSKKARIDSEISDDFFTGTAFESSRKGKERGDNPDSDDGLPEPSAQLEHSGTERTHRALSSSPPPADTDLPPPETEYMRKGIGKFDLRDDEWMMVEDEFLQTAKLFTRHLHLAEYQRLKQNIQEKKTEVSRPVVPHSKPSDEGQMRMKAEAQKRAQKNAIRAVTIDEEEEDYLGASRRAGSSKSLSTSFTKPSSSRTTTSRSLKKDVDPRPKKPPTRTTNVSSSDVSDEEDLDNPKRSNRPSNSSLQQFSTSTRNDCFVKPALPPNPRPRPSSSRPSTFTTFDNYSPPLPRSAPPTKVSRPLTSTSTSSTSKFSKPTQPSKYEAPSTTTTTSHVKPPPSLFDPWDEPFPRKATASAKASKSKSTSTSTSASASSGQMDRLAKRKAEREKEKAKEVQKQKRKSVKLDDIPTFLF